MPRPRTLTLDKHPVVLYLLVVLAIAICITYYPGLNGPFLLDDSVNIVQNESIALDRLNAGDLTRATMANESGPLKRMLASLSFALNHYFAGGFDPFSFKTTNLIIHLINTFLVFRLILLLVSTPALNRRFTGDQKTIIALASATWWGLHPLQVTSVLYAVQRMNSLSALFVLGGLILFLMGRTILKRNMIKGFRLMSVGCVFGLFLGLTAKENAALLPLFALVIELTMFPREKLKTDIKRHLKSFYLILVALPLVIFLLYLSLNPGVISESYAVREFTPMQRLWTESRILWFYLGLILVPDVRQLGFFHDDIVLSTALFSPVTTLFAVCGWMLVIIFILFRTRRYPIVSFALAWFLVGHVLESGPFGLELAFDHRNYVPSLGILFALSCGLIMFLSRFKIQLYRSAATIVSLLALVLAFGTTSLAQTLSSADTLADKAIRHHPRSPRAIDLAINVSLLKGEIEPAIHYSVQGISAFPHKAGFQIDLQILLARVSSQILQALSQQTDLMNTSKVSIEGLPDCVNATKQNATWRVMCDLSANDKIIENLKSQPITVHTSLSLKKASNCIMSREVGCELLRDNALDWFRAATDNPRTTRLIKQDLFMEAALLFGFIEDYRSAYKNISAAAQLSPETLAYKLGQTEYLIRLGRYGEAAELLNQATDEKSVDERQLENNKAAIETLRTILDGQS